MRHIYPAHAQLYIGKSRLLYCGPLQHLDAHVYGTAVLHVGVYQPFRIRLAGGEWQTCRCVVVPAGVRHALDVAGGVLGKLFVERDSPDFAGFCQRFPHGKAAAFFEDAQTLECFRWVCEEDPARADLDQRLDDLLEAGFLRLSASDVRIQRIMEAISKEPERNFPQQELAAMVGLSPSRFLHLFRQHTGVSYRRFRMWKRLLSAAE